MDLLAPPYCLRAPDALLAEDPTNPRGAHLAYWDLTAGPLRPLGSPGGYGRGYRGGGPDPACAYESPAAGRGL